MIFYKQKIYRPALQYKLRLNEQTQLVSKVMMMSHRAKYTESCYDVEFFLWIVSYYLMFPVWAQSRCDSLSHDMPVTEAFLKCHFYSIIWVIICGPLGGRGSWRCWFRAVLALHSLQSFIFAVLKLLCETHFRFKEILKWHACILYLHLHLCLYIIV